MNLAILADPASGALVIAGTILATILRCGILETQAALLALAALCRPRFSCTRERSAMARQVEDIRRHGVLRARFLPNADREIAEATEALLRYRSLSALREAHDRHRARRLLQRERAVHLFDQAGELAPVLGLAGTLVALSQLQAAGETAAGPNAAIGMAVLTTLYGLILAHLACLPLARLIARRGEHEEQERQALIDWLGLQLEPAMPAPSPGLSPPKAQDLAA